MSHNVMYHTQTLQRRQRCLTNMYHTLVLQRWQRCLACSSHTNLATVAAMSYNRDTVSHTCSGSNGGVSHICSSGKSDRESASHPHTSEPEPTPTSQPKLVPGQLPLGHCSDRRRQQRAPTAAESINQQPRSGRNKLRPLQNRPAAS